MFIFMLQEDPLLESGIKYSDFFKGFITGQIIMLSVILVLIRILFLRGLSRSRKAILDQNSFALVVKLKYLFDF